MMEIAPHRKHLSFDEILKKRQECAENHQQVVLTNGCFDLLHVGHLSYLEQAKKQGDVLIIALNGEASIRALKGPGRPINGDLERTWALGALECVDFIFIFEGMRLDHEISLLRPDVYVKAGDYTLETLNKEERKALESVGATIKFLPFISGFSTTQLIEKIINKDNVYDTVKV